MEFIVQQMVKPAIHRLGTGLGTMLSGYGMAATDISTIQAAAPVLLGFLVDLVVRKAVR